MPRTARPEKFGPNRWRIRWTDHTGKRRGEMHRSFAEAEAALIARKAETAEIKRGVRAAIIPGKTVGDVCDYWLENRARRKRSGGDDASMIRCLELIRISGERESKQRVGIRSAAQPSQVFDN